MSQENNNFKFNIDLLMNDVNNVIQNGINNLLSDFTTNYKLYEETHNCIMNLPSIKREFAKKNLEEGYDYLMDFPIVNSKISTKNEDDENYDDLPDLISVSSHEDVPGMESSFCDNYTRIPIEEDSDQESDDTMLCMKKIANQLLKEKEDTVALFQKETNSYKEIIENCYKEIENLKNQINELKNSSIVCDLTVDGEDTQELIVEIKKEKEEKQEKENIVLHMEEESGTEEENDSLAVDSESVEEEEEEEEEESDSEVVEESTDSVVVDSEVVEEEDSVVVDSEVVEEESEEKTDIETEKSDEDTVETEKSDEKDFVEEEEEEELIEIEIDDITYCTNDENNGLIYELDKDGNVGETVGYLKDGEPFFN